MHAGQGKSRTPLPTVWLMSDERVATDDLLRAIARLPRQSALILRHYRLDPIARRALFNQVRRAAHKRHCRILLAGDADMARHWGADGHHGPTAGPRDPRWLHSAPAHGHKEMRAAQRAGADVVLLSPLFRTRSHPGARPLGPARFAALARLATLPVIALGGVHPHHAALVRRLGAVGYAAIDGLTPRRGPRGDAI
ncbi:MULTISPECIES: thiamine phosphate synthase [unclassified Sphingobium]|uniref:thiamine phosphate synthase n=1 Tax=unclassified Sphingobium TaxID=2611147 RepID=UPI002224535C|nr:MULTISPECIES: thiamine phosphate synthase [unclassified Sphingobium]MCW2386019.1 thiamine-phosphate pyrophosphorylase [Sphingobium sp. B2D3D]